MSESANTAGHANTITVTGHGAVNAEPDYFHIHIGIEARRNNVKEAYAAAADAVAAVQQRLAGLSVARDMVGTEALNVHADTQWQEGKASVVTGYVVTTSLNVVLRYDDAAADIIAAVVDAGGDAVRLNGLSPAVSDPSAAQDAARTVAWADARRAAELYAGMAGRTLGAPTAITEMQDQGMMPRGTMDLAFQSSGPAIPVDPGQHGITATVQVTWQLL